MTDVELINKLCLKFCPYYKPSKDEELACMAYIVLERLMEKGDKIPFEKPGKAVDSSTVETLAEKDLHYWGNSLKQKLFSLMI
jgi:hypothetical protein